MDSLVVNGLVFLTLVRKPIYFRDAVPVENNSVKSFYEALDITLHQYNKAGYTIKTICCNCEFQPLLNDVQDNCIISMDYTIPGDHESPAERNKRTTREWYRASLNILPFKVILPDKIRELIVVMLCNMNMFPSNHGISLNFSPNIFIGKPPIDYLKDLCYLFGKYGQAHLDRIKTNDST